eukprot:6213175-Pleurochrysis_carterae.AAC.7
MLETGGVEFQIGRHTWCRKSAGRRDPKSAGAACLERHELGQLLQRRNRRELVVREVDHLESERGDA